MSQKPFMWNKNNPLQYSDPSGYYTFDNGTSDQQKQFDAAAKAMDKRVLSKMSTLKKTSTEYKALAAFHEDLQKGSGNWHIRFGSSGDPQAGGYTNVNTVIRGEHNSTIAGVGATVIDTTRNNNASDWAATLAQEGGIFEVASGRAGAAAKRDFAEASWMDYGNTEYRGPNMPPGPSDMARDNVVNALYNIPLGVPQDY